MKKKLGLLAVISGLMFLFSGCYTLKSQSIPDSLKTINVGFFDNNAPLVVSNLSQTFTESLKTRIRTTTSLSIVNGEGDANITGAITDYRSVPVSIQSLNNNAPPIAGAQALSITIKCKFDYPARKDLSFDQTFTKTLNYSGNLASQEQKLIQTLTSQIIDDIFNKAFNNW